MRDRAELAAVLRRLCELLPADDDEPNDWSRYAPAELHAEIQSFLDDVEAGRPIDEAGRQHLGLLFAPTGALQEDSLARGWAGEYLELSSRFDRAV
jgi:hypothetical protein